MGNYFLDIMYGKETMDGKDMKRGKINKRETTFKSQDRGARPRGLNPDPDGGKFKLVLT